MASTVKENIVEQAKYTYESLDASYDGLYNASVKKVDREHLKAMLGAARDAYWKAESDDLRDDNKYVKKLMDELGSVNSVIQKALDKQKKAADIIALFAEAVKLVAAVVTLAAAA